MEGLFKISTHDWKKKTAASNCSPAETRNLTTAINGKKIILTSQRGYSQGRG